MLSIRGHNSYVGHMVVELEMVIDYRVLRVIELQEVLECPSSFFMIRFHIICIGRFDIYDWARVASQEAGQTDWAGK